MKSEELVGAPLFTGLTPKQLALLAPLFTRVRFSAGETIFAEGGRAEAVYVLERGEVSIRFRPYDGDWMPIATVRAGGVVGWSAAFGRSHYTSSAICLTDVEAFVIPGDKLRSVARTDPELSVLLLGRMALAISNRLIAQVIHDEVGQTT